MSKYLEDYSYDATSGIAYCEIKAYGTTFHGTAFAHPDDMDLCSEKTGCQIAGWRAYIQLLCYERDHIILPQLEAYKQLYHSMNRSKHFNSKSYEAKMLYKAIKRAEADLKETRQALAIERRALREYIAGKDKLYQRIRAREGQKDTN